MKTDTVRMVFTYSIAILIYVGAYQALISSEFIVDDFTKGIIANLTGAATGFVFGAEIATRASRQTRSDLMTPTPGAEGTTVTPPPGATSTTTVTSEPPAVPDTSS